MSFDAVQEWAFKLELPVMEKMVLLVLSNHADESDSCFPGQVTIAIEAGMSEKSVRRALERLERRGLIKRERRYRDENGLHYRTSDRYLLQRTALFEGPSLPARESGNSVNPKVHRSAEIDDAEKTYRTMSPNLPDFQSKLTGQSDRAESVRESVSESVRVNAGAFARSKSTSTLLEAVSENEPFESSKMTGKSSLEESRAKQPSAKKSLIRADFTFDGAMEAWVRNEFPRMNYMFETEKFRDYYLAKGIPLVDWKDAWRKWMRGAASGDHS